MSARRSSPRPLRLGVVGLVHGHVEGLLWRARARDDLELVGVCEPDVDLFGRLGEVYGLDPRLRYDDLGAMLERARPEAVSVMTPVAGHRDAVAACAPRGVHALLEKPLAFDRGEAEAIAALATTHGVHVLTNFETSWYPSVREAARRVRDGDLGCLRRMVFRHGHSGPVEIGCRPEFVAWLTDPVQSGGGALVDFGCYGAALATWLMGGARPLEVLASASSWRSGPYGRVDDDATLVLRFAQATAVVQASWAWPHDCKEFDLYGERGSLHGGQGPRLGRRRPDGALVPVPTPPNPASLTDEWTYLRRVVRGECGVDPLSSLELNLIVAEILDEARRQVAAGG